MAAKQTPARRHHVVSKFYLRAFADSDERVARVPLGASDERRVIGITDATVRKDFYKLDVEGRPSDAFEQALGDVEADAAPAFRRLIATTDEVSNQDRYLIAMWAALQHLRSESTRQAGDEITRRFSKLELGVSTTSQIRERMEIDSDVPDEEVEALRARMLATADTFEVDHHQHLRLIAENLEGIVNLVFFRHPWIVQRYERKVLLTSDTPVAMFENSYMTAQEIGSSIGTAPALYLPISRRIGLLMGDLPPLEDKIKPTTIQGPGSAYSARMMNQLTVWNARRAVFHHPDDDPLAKLHPGAPRTDEMNISNSDELIRAFARQQGRSSGLAGDDDELDSTHTAAP